MRIWIFGCSSDANNNNVSIFKQNTVQQNVETNKWKYKQIKMFALEQRRGKLNLNLINKNEN